MELHYTPKHGSWLNMAENEQSSMMQQCLVAGRRIGSIEELASDTTAWHEDVNNTEREIDWQMKTDDARHKLNLLYPKIKM
ncbi:MAG: hypothetical protein R3B84_24785 [Zavarzinella sp.]